MYLQKKVLHQLTVINSPNLNGRSRGWVLEVAEEAMEVGNYL